MKQLNEDLASKAKENQELKIENALIKSKVE